ncbi:MAG: hypothetical protein EXS41_00640 [Opitutaceae bacterium]|nr:hypothetical protein [Opitutaceae bacterium]
MDFASLVSVCGAPAFIPEPTHASKTPRRRLLFSIISLALAGEGTAQRDAAVAGPAERSKVSRVGAATSTITPGLGAIVVGGFVRPKSTQIDDELHARCLVLDDGATRLVFVVADNAGVAREIFDEAKRRLQKGDAGADRAHDDVRHSHPLGAGRAWGRTCGFGSKTLDEYQEFFIQRIVKGVQRAVNYLRPAQRGWGGQVPQHVFNRR